jgi:hypothetical protein
MIRVICPDLMCFWVDETTLDPLSPAVWDAYAVSHPLPGPSITYGQWTARQRWGVTPQMLSDL